MDEKRIAADGTAGSPQVELTAPVREVTLLEDRAQVVRRGAATLPAGRVRVCVRGVSPVLGDKTLGATLLAAPPGARVSSLRVRRFPHLERTERPRDQAELDTRLHAAEEQLAGLRQRRDLLDGEWQLLRESGRRCLQDA